MRSIWLFIAVISLVSGCGDDKNSPQSNATLVTQTQTQTYALTGKVRNLRAGAMLVLQNNGGDDVIVRPGASTFSFSTKIAKGASYSVEIHTQLGQKCSVKNGKGVVAAADVAGIVLECSKLDNELLANQRKEFTSILQLNEGFVTTNASQAKDALGIDPTTECAAKIETKKDIVALNEKIKVDNLPDWPFEIKNNKSLAGKIGQKAIFKSLAELKKCKELGDEWRNKNYFPEMVSVVDKSYADVFALAINLYAKKISYAGYARQNLAIRANFKTQINQAMQQAHNQQADAQKLRELEQQRLEALAQQQEIEKQLAEKQRLELLAQPTDEERKRLAEEQRLTDLSLKQEEQILQAEEQRLKNIELQKKQQLEQEKEFQRLHQRQQIDRLR
jgi:predicted XRE-type DNA-binding protein